MPIHIQSRIALIATSLVLSLAIPGQAARPNLEQDAATRRAQGQAGLTAFVETYAKELSAGAASNTGDALAARAALDQLCQQRDCYASRLYWYTDLDQAKAVAKASGKPILSLRLLGELDEDLSCANSRFFRVALYANADISQFLRDRFVLHWESVRPVPTVTIDFGDGRKLVRTVTGNSIHYVLDAAGHPIDAIPGLYGPQAFLRQLQRSEQIAQDYSRRAEAGRAAFLQQYHRDRLVAIQSQWAEDLQRLGVTPLPKLAELPLTLTTAPTAGDASRLAMTKMAVEIPVLRSFGLLAYGNQQALAAITDQPTWNRLASLYQSSARLDSNSLALIQAKRNTGATERSLPSVIQEFETTMALDTVRNEYLLHSQLHQWFVEGESAMSITALNDRVYAELFLTPGSDPWLGLNPTNSYSAIDNDGIR